MRRTRSCSRRVGRRRNSDAASGHPAAGEDEEPALLPLMPSFSRPRARMPRSERNRRPLRPVRPLPPPPPLTPPPALMLLFGSGSESVAKGGEGVGPSTQLHCMNSSPSEKCSNRSSFDRGFGFGFGTCLCCGAPHTHTCLVFGGSGALQLASLFFLPASSLP